MTFTLLICGLSALQTGIGCNLIVAARVLKSGRLLRAGLGWWGMALLALSVTTAANTIEALS